jgi:PPOX class probable F420-dependent enzyme
MEISEALEYVRSNHRAVLATTKRDGTPQLTPVTVGVDGAGHVVLSTREALAKVKNLRRDPRASVCVFPDAFYGHWVTINGGAEIVSLPDALELLVDYYRDISGEHPDWDDYRAAMVRDGRCLVRITPTSVVAG